MKEIKMIDAHCHLNFKAFAEDVDEVVKRADEAGVKTIINAGTQVSSSEWAVKLAEKHKGLYAVIAVHPHHADKIEEGWDSKLLELGKNKKVVGIGECGLDYFSYKSNGIASPEAQRKIFIRQLEIAHELDLPLQIHSRDEQARLDILDILESKKELLRKNPGIFHCVAGSIESLDRILALGFAVGFDGNVMYEGAPDSEPLEIKKLAEHTPVEKIVIETDSPYLTPPPYRGQRNEPKNAIITANFISELKGIPFEKFVEQTNKNVYTIFTRIKH